MPRPFVVAVLIAHQSNNYVRGLFRIYMIARIDASVKLMIIYNSAICNGVFQEDDNVVKLLEYISLSNE